MAGSIGLVPGLRASAEQRWQRWIHRRIPPARSITLDQKRIFIFPSRVGLFFGLALMLMLLTAINYQNNMAFALTFLLTNLFLVGILHTYANLSGLTVHAVSAETGFPGQQAEFELLIERQRRREHYGIRLAWRDSTEVLVNLADTDSLRVQLHAPLGERGWYSPGRLLVESTYPLGLLRSWTWIDLDLKALVYPAPLPPPEPAAPSCASPDGHSDPAPGEDDFQGFRDYREGDSLRQVYWKGLARGQNLQTRLNTAYVDRSHWLDWNTLPDAGIERRLSWLCYRVLECERDREEYGLRLPGLTLEAGLGEKHRDRVLKELALFRAGGADAA